MNTGQDLFQAIGTVTAFLAFLGVCWWVYIARSKGDFDEAANLPFIDENPEQEQQQEQQQGKDSEENSI